MTTQPSVSLDERLAALLKASPRQLRSDLVAALCFAAHVSGPLDAEGLASLLTNEPRPDARALKRAEEALEAGAWAIAESEVSQAIREIPTHKHTWGGITTARCRAARKALAAIAIRWGELPEGSLRRCVLRWGDGWAVDWGGKAALDPCVGRLTGFGAVQARFEADDAGRVGLLSAYLKAGAKLAATDTRQIALWAFGDGIQRAVDGEMGLLEVAMSLDVSNPLRIAAEAWLDAGCGRWSGPRRPAEPPAPSCVRVLEGHKDTVLRATIRDNGQIISCSWAGDVRLWSSEGELVFVFDAGLKWARGALERPGDRLMTWYDSPEICLWDLSSGERLATFDEHSGSVSNVVPLDDGRSISWNVREMLLRAVEGEVVATLFETVGDFISRPVGGAFQVDSESVLVSIGRELEIRAIETGEVVRKLEGHKFSFLGVEHLPEQEALVTWAMDNTIRRWDLRATPGGSVVFKGHSRQIMGVCVLDEGQMASCSLDKTVRVWDMASGRQRFVLKGHGEGVTHLRDLGDGRLMSASKDGTLRLWDWRTGAHLGAIEGHGDWIWGVCVVAGARVISCARNGEMSLWDLGSRRLLAKMAGHRSGVLKAQQMGRGRVLSHSTDNTLKIWSVPDVMGSVP